LNRASTDIQDGGQANEEPNNAERADVPVVARISVHVLRQERAYDIYKILAQTVDSDGYHGARPVGRLRLPGQRESGPISVCIFEDLGPNYLSKVIDFGPAWFYFSMQGDIIHGYPYQKFVPEPMSLQKFLDFAIGATECIEILHTRQIVHGEVRGDAFHMNAETGEVALINVGPGRLRTFELGLTSTAWSSMSKEIGAKTKLSYMSPEQTGRMPLEPDSRTDIFSLGVLFWTILSQKPAFEGDTAMDTIQAVLGQRLPLISNIRLDIPEVIGRIIQKATAKTVWDRYHSVSGLRYDLVEVRRLLGLGDSSQLPKWEIATKDVSPAFILPQAMVGRAVEHDTIVRLIDHAFRMRQANQRQDKHSTPVSTQLFPLSEDQLTGVEVILPISGGDASFEDRSASSIDGGTRQLSISDTAIADSGPYEASTGKSRSRASSSHDLTNVNGLGLSDSKPKLSEKMISRSLESPSHESMNGAGEGSISSADGIGGMIMNRNNVGIRTNGRCEVITVAGAAGLGKTRLLQSVQVEARQRGYFTSTKFDQSQTEKKPFDPILKLLSSLFQQLFSESHMDPTFHHILRRRVAPVWHMLHKMLGLPEILFGSYLPSRTASQSSRYNESLGVESKRRDSSPRSTSSRDGLALRSKIGSQRSRNFLLAGSSTQSMSLMGIILDILRIFARHKFICICLDDLHLADEESLELVAQVVSTRVKMVIIVAYRPEHILSDSMRRILDPVHEKGTALRRKNIRCR
jgi:serine/threonine protein kinase